MSRFLIFTKLDVPSLGAELHIRKILLFVEVLLGLLLRFNDINMAVIHINCYSKKIPVYKHGILRFLCHWVYLEAAACF